LLGSNTVTQSLAQGFIQEHSVERDRRGSHVQKPRLLIGDRGAYRYRVGAMEPLGSAMQATMASVFDIETA
jgi:hypothetical protein